MNARFWLLLVAVPGVLSLAVLAAIVHVRRRVERS